jgi:NDP-sugar pyrophosphorylase family protein
MPPVAILAGGLATRLRPVTQTIPKSLVDVAGQPFVCRQLAQLRQQGIERVVLCVGHLANMIEATVGNGERFGLRVAYSPDGAQPLGTGGALKKALPLLEQRFFVLYGDSYLPVDFAAVEQAHARSGKDALMTVLKNNGQWDRSNVLFRDEELLEYNKHQPRPEMAYIDYGLGVLDAKVLAAYPAGQAFDLADVYQALALQGRLAGWEAHERFYEIGSHNGLAETRAYFLKKESA